MMPTSDNTALVRRMVEEVWNRGDLDAADVLFSAGYTNHGGLIIDVVHGPEAIKMSVGMYKSAFPDFWITIDDLRADGPRVFLRWTARRNVPSVRRNGAPDTVSQFMPGSSVCSISEGKIVESWTSWNQASVVRSLGLRPA